MSRLLREHTHVAKRGGLCLKTKRSIAHFPMWRHGATEFPAAGVVVAARNEDAVGGRPLLLGPRAGPIGLRFRADEAIGAESFEFGAAAGIEQFVIAPVQRSQKLQ